MTASQPTRAERVRRLHGAVVELDALADAHRARADDERRGPGHRRRLGRRAGRRIRGVEVGRLGRELGGTGVDHREARPQADGQPSLERPPAGSRPVSVAMSRSPNEARLAATSRPSVTRAPLLRHPVGEVDEPLHLRQEPGRDAGDLVQLGGLDTTAQQRQEAPEAGVGRRQELLEQLRAGHDPAAR